jgi:hypothetical protein
MTRLSCHRFRSKQVRLWLSEVTYNLGNLWRRLVLPTRIDNWLLTSFEQRLVKTVGRRLVKHARYCWLRVAESHLTRRLTRHPFLFFQAFPNATTGILANGFPNYRKRIHGSSYIVAFGRRRLNSVHLDLRFTLGTDVVFTPDEKRSQGGAH